MISAQAISNDHADVFQFLRGDLSREATACHVPQEACHDSLVFVSDGRQMAEARSHRPAILIVRAGAVDELAPKLSDDGCYFSVKSVSMGMATLLRYFDRKPERFTSWGKRHPTALIHASAHVDDSAVVGPFCSIGAHTSIGAGTLIGAHCVIENDVAIGARSIIHPHVFIGARCQVGNECEIHPHTTIGSDGFGYAVDGDGRPKKIAHLGNVVIEDQVEIGSNCAVDRATLTSTFIRSGTKLDNICHIAHNCDLGENGFYTAGFMMGGSTKIGRHFVSGGNAVVTAHVTLGDNIILAGRSTVTKDVPLAGSYGGYPLQPLAEAMRTVVNIGRLNEISKQLNRIRKHLGLS